MDIAQERRLVTEIPGPRSRALLERRQAAVTSGLASSLPVFVEAASGAILRDVDGNQLIDLGAGHLGPERRQHLAGRGPGGARAARPVHSPVHAGRPSTSRTSSWPNA